MQWLKKINSSYFGKIPILSRGKNRKKEHLPMENAPYRQFRL
jgi:hypothetical protein